MQFDKDPQSPKQLVDLEGQLYSEYPNGHVSFGDVARNLLGEQSQYASKYIFRKAPDYPSLEKGLRFSADGYIKFGDYHSIGIHPDDIEEFRYRYEAYKAYSTGRIQDPAGHTQLP